MEQNTDASMEVHYHPHPPHKKKLKEYLFEFLMLLMAVIGGFFAENLHDNHVDREREKEYVERIIKNLELDTTDLHTFIDANNNEKEYLLQLAVLLKHYNDTGDSTSVSSIIIGGYRSIKSPLVFSSHEGVMIQLQNSGEFRTIIQDHAADSIASYQDIINDTKIANVSYNSEFEKLRDVLSQCFDISYVTNAIYFSQATFDPTDVSLPPQAVIGSLYGMRYFYNKLLQYEGLTDNYVTFTLEPQLKKAKDLIAYLKKTYDIK